MHMLPGECPIEERIPPEILSYVFTLALVAEGETSAEGNAAVCDGEEKHPCTEEPISATGDGDLDGRRRLIPLPVEVRLSHVCRRWRKVAISTPTLWTRLDFLNESFELNVELVARSGQCPLDITINNVVPEEEALKISAALQSRNNSMSVEDLDDSEDGNALTIFAFQCVDLSRTLDLIIPHVARWRKLHFSTSLYIHMLPLLWRLQETSGAHLLESLELHCYDQQRIVLTHFERQSFNETSIPLFHGSAPKLTSIILEGIFVDFNLLVPASGRPTLPSRSMLISPSNNLTVLNLSYFEMKYLSPMQFLEALRCAVGLRSLSLVSCGPILNDDTWIEPLLLGNLRELTLGYLKSKYASRLIRLFYAPSLTSLVLDFRIEGEDYTEFVERLIAPMWPPHISIQLSENTIPMDRSISASILANLVDVKLKGLSCSTDAQSRLYDACPNVLRLFLNMDSLHAAFIYTLTQGTIFRSQGPAFPMLEELTIIGLRSLTLAHIAVLRKAQGLPFKKLIVDAHDVSFAEYKKLKEVVGTVEYRELRT